MILLAGWFLPQGIITTGGLGMVDTHDLDRLADDGNPHIDTDD